MPLVSTDALLTAAKRGGYAIGAFECWDSASAQGIAFAARDCRMPVIFQATPLEYKLAGGPRALRQIVDIYVGMTGITAALHLDHGTTLAHVEECLEAGFTSIMLDGSRLPLEENIALSRRAATMAHAAHASVEAELGRVGGAEGAIADEAGAGDEADGSLTDPSQAARFVKETGIDCLAVAIGTVHGDYRGTPRIRLDRLGEIGAAVAVPLVLHGGSGTPVDILKRAIDLGVAKINICTDLNKAWLSGIDVARARLTPSIPGTFYMPALDSLTRTAAQHIALFSNGRAVMQERA